MERQQPREANYDDIFFEIDWSAGLPAQAMVGEILPSSSEKSETAPPKIIFKWRSQESLDGELF